MNSKTAPTHTPPASRSVIPWLLGAAVVAWMVCFWAFLSGQVLLTGDAPPYYGHIKFYIDSLLSGAYPLWDHPRDFGVPTEFFMRRIGSYNPFYVIIVLLRLVGVKHLYAYSAFLSLYYVLGMAGFYVLARAIFARRFAALTACLLLMFSSLSTLLFDSFLILTYTPIIWFFTFMILFYKSPQRAFVLGAVFCWMLIVLTYVPFYFISILTGFILLFIMFYPKLVLDYLKKWFGFIRSNRWLSLAAAVLIAVSLVPGANFFIEAQQGEIVMPVRHKDSDAANILQVAKQNYLEGGINSLNLINEMFSGYQNIRVGQFYLPIFAHILFLLGLTVALNKRMAMLAVWAFLFYCIGVYEASPLYGFLYEHVFLFKYLRNLQYFLWLVLLPAYILICVDLFRIFVSAPYAEKGRRQSVIIFLGVIHVAALGYLFYEKGLIVSSWAAVGLSFYVLKTMCLDKKGEVPFRLWIALFLAIVIQPLEVYQYMQNNAPIKDRIYRYEDNYQKFQLPEVAVDPKTEFDDKRNENCLWFGVRHVHDLCREVNHQALSALSSFPLVLYDAVNAEKDGFSFRELERTVIDRQNVAWISVPEGEAIPGLDSRGTPHPDVLLTTSQNFELEHYDNTRLAFNLTVDRPRFLVYHDAFYSRWQASVDGERVPLYRANYAFKGIFLPEGSHYVEFRFGPVWLPWLHLVWIGLYFGVFLWLIHLIMRERPEELAW